MVERETFCLDGSGLLTKMADMSIYLKKKKKKKQFKNILFWEQHNGLVISH